MVYELITLISGLILLIWSADRFIDGSVSVANHLGIPSLLVGMVIVGFGTSAPEMFVSALASFQNNPGIALGNAYGSNIVNIGLILGITALINPIRVNSTLLRKELPILTIVTILSGFLIHDLRLSLSDSIILLMVFSGLISWTIYQGMKRKSDTLAAEIETASVIRPLPIGWAVFWLFSGLLLLIVSSRLLVWGAIEFAHIFGISDMVIGLTIVAIGTSLPELASSVTAARKKEHDIALGNILGSNLFNTLAVVGIAGVIHPFELEHEIISRDMLIMGILTILLFATGYGFRSRHGRISRVEGAALLIVYLIYTAWLIKGAIAGSGRDL